MTTLNARANQAWQEAEFFASEQAAFEEGWETGYKAAQAEAAAPHLEPAGDGGLREALKELVADRQFEDGSPTGVLILPEDVQYLLAAHPATHAVSVDTAESTASTSAVPQPACLGDGVCTNPHCPAHGLGAVPLPVDREALERALRERMRNSNFADNLHEPIRTQTIDQWADLFAGTVLALLGGSAGEQVEP